MGREKRLSYLILRIHICICVATICPSCDTSGGQADVSIYFSNMVSDVKSSPPDEFKITDISLMIFDESGDAEECIWLDRGEMSWGTTLLTDKTYTFCACANFGYQVYADHIEELQEIRFHMAYPDEYSEGIPMAAFEIIEISDDCSIEIGLKKLMAKISLIMDRNGLDEDVEMNVRSARIGNCPRFVFPFRESRITSGDEAFPTGYLLDDNQTSALNRAAGKGLSEEVSLYMFENLQGYMEYPIESDNDKVFGEYDHRRDICSYIEMEIEYLSDDRISTESGLIYRFYLGEDRNSFDIRRNTHYHITVTPRDDGLSYDGWRVDQSGIESRHKTEFAAYPSDYIVGNIGDTIHIWCEFSPADAPFDIGISYMEDDKAEGIYDYIIDDDGHGAVLTLTGPGRGLIYMEAGEPVNDAALFIIEVNQP